MYKVFPQSLQSKVCKNFGIINQRQMKQFLSVLTKFRNVCAHGERLFTYRTIDNISDLPLHRKMSIPMSGIQYQYGKNDLFAVVHHQFPIFVQYDPCCVETISRMLHQEEFFSIYDDTVKGKPASFFSFDMKICGIKGY